MSAVTRKTCLEKTLSNVTTRVIREEEPDNQSPAGQGDVCELCWGYGGVGVGQCELYDCVFNMPDLVVCSRRKHTSQLAVSGQPKRTHLPTAGSCQPAELYFWSPTQELGRLPATVRTPRGPLVLERCSLLGTSRKERNWDGDSLWVLCFSFSFTAPHLPYYHLTRPKSPLTIIPSGSFSATPSTLGKPVLKDQSEESCSQREPSFAVSPS